MIIWKLETFIFLVNISTGDKRLVVVSHGKCVLKFIPAHALIPWHIQEVETLENCEIACLNFIFIRQHITFDCFCVLCAAWCSSTLENCKLFLLISPFRSHWSVYIFVICEFPPTPFRERVLPLCTKIHKHLKCSDYNSGQIWENIYLRLAIPVKSSLSSSCKCLDILTLIYNFTHTSDMFPKKESEQQTKGTHTPHSSRNGIKV